MYSIFSKYHSDPEIAALCSDEAYLKHMTVVECALAKVQGELGIIPKEAANEIISRLPALKYSMDELMDDTARNGIPVIGFLAQARKALKEPCADYLHWGVTSQDITDTAQVLILKDVLKVVETRTGNIIDHLNIQKARYGKIPMLARTRNQSAVPITFGQKLESWTAPLDRYLKRLEELKARLFTIQLAGAGGQLAGQGEQSVRVVKEVSLILELNYSEGWHSQRDRMVEAADLLANLVGTLGKLGEDVLFLTQSEIGELHEFGKGGGTSSSMPHKNNPVRSEALVALSRYALGLSGMFKQSLLHRNERDGISLSLEWMILPQLIATVGASLNHALAISEHLVVNEKRMRFNLERQNGLIYSEKALYLLTNYMSRTEAKTCITRACTMVMAENISLAQALKHLQPDIRLDWEDQLSI